MKYQLVDVSGHVAIKDNLELSEMQSFVGGSIEFDGRFIINEDGFLKNLPQNVAYPYYLGNVIRFMGNGPQRKTK